MGSEQTDPTPRSHHGSTGTGYRWRCCLIPEKTFGLREIPLGLKTQVCAYRTGAATYAVPGRNGSQENSTPVLPQAAWTGLHVLRGTRGGLPAEEGGGCSDAPAEDAGEVRLVGEAARRCDIDEGLGGRGKQRLRMLKPELHVVLVRRDARTRLEHAKEVSSAVTAALRQLLQANVLVEVRAEQLDRSLERIRRKLRDSPMSGRILLAVKLERANRDRVRQRIDVELAGGMLFLQELNQLMKEAAQRRIVESGANVKRRTPSAKLFRDHLVDEVGSEGAVDQLGR